MFPFNQTISLIKQELCFTSVPHVQLKKISCYYLLRKALKDSLLTGNPWDQMCFGIQHFWISEGDAHGLPLASSQGSALNQAPRGPQRNV